MTKEEALLIIEDYRPCPHIYAFESVRGIARGYECEKCGWWMTPEGLDKAREEYDCFEKALEVLCK